jgi:hypothetical protein
LRADIATQRSLHLLQHEVGLAPSSSVKVSAEQITVSGNLILFKSLSPPFLVPWAIRHS